MWSKTFNPEKLKTDLQPTLEQMIIPHHPYLDLIPFPSFRKGALKSIACRSLKLSEDELRFDLMNADMQCWRSSGISLHGLEKEQPGTHAVGKPPGF